MPRNCSFLCSAPRLTGYHIHTARWRVTEKRLRSVAWAEQIWEESISSTLRLPAASRIGQNNVFESKNKGIVDVLITFYKYTETERAFSRHTLSVQLSVGDWTVILTELPALPSVYVSVLGSTASSASRILSTGMSSLKLLVDSTSFSPLSFPRCLSSCTAANTQTHMSHITVWVKCQ